MSNPLSKADATRLANKIKRYWKARGHNVETAVIRQDNPDTPGDGIYVVRSDMVNGLPRSKYAKLVFPVLAA